MTFLHLLHWSKGDEKPLSLITEEFYKVMFLYVKSESFKNDEGLKHLDLAISFYDLVYSLSNCTLNS
ncbi:CLUMA_CG001963, isoform A [Clunio marinus]|uniref:CLUMA_CG001963, isoform A n=1 Tax=Clunio marinus TaxID=568069 RepID=A0A1J1HKW6_9DIPT|nr:CLUMA_CG001963, isoform A [Clunio marinus]